MSKAQARELPNLERVTLVAVSSVAIPATIDALRASMAQANFSQVLLLSDKRPPADVDPAIVWRQIAPIRSRTDYSRFMVRDLVDYIGTSHLLCIQWDGFVLRGDAWDPRFLDFDYIGAVWPQFSDGHSVGNGGFSLRSRRLLEECRELPFDGDVAEDVFICRLHRSELEQKGVRFAPESVARRFSFERTSASGDEFGFHGCFNLVQITNPEAALRLVQSLEPQVLSRRERLELLRWAVMRRRFKLAAVLLARFLIRGHRP